MPTPDPLSPALHRLRKKENPGVSPAREWAGRRAGDCFCPDCLGLFRERKNFRGTRRLRGNLHLRKTHKIADAAPSIPDCPRNAYFQRRHALFQRHAETFPTGGLQGKNGFGTAAQHRFCQKPAVRARMLDFLPEMCLYAPVAMFKIRSSLQGRISSARTVMRCDSAEWAGTSCPCRAVSAILMIAI